MEDFMLHEESVVDLMNKKIKSILHEAEEDEDIDGEELEELMYCTKILKTYCKIKFMAMMKHKGGMDVGNVMSSPVPLQYNPTAHPHLTTSAPLTNNPK